MFLWVLSNTFLPLKLRSCLVMSCVQQQNELCLKMKHRRLLLEIIAGSSIVACIFVICVLIFEQNDHIFILWEKNANEWILINILIYNLHMKWKFNFLNHIYREAIFCATTKYLQKLLQNHMSISICAYVLVIGFWKLW